MTLTPRQAKVADLVLEGMYPKEIDYELGIHEKVASHHLQHIYRKYGITDGVKIVKLAVALYYERHPEARV